MRELSISPLRVFQALLGLVFFLYFTPISGTSPPLPPRPLPLKLYLHEPGNKPQGLLKLYTPI